MQLQRYMTTAMVLHCLMNCKADNFQGPNIAINQTASQLPKTLNSLEARYAVDGNFANDITINGDKCAHTDFSDTVASWTVILDQAYSITGISLLNRKNEEYRIRLKNFKILGNGRELYRNVETTGSCPYNNEQTPSICDETLRIPVDNGDNINNITILVNSHTNDNNYPKDEKKAILTLCEVQIFATVCLLPDISNGYIAPAKIYTTQGSTIKIICNEGYRPSGNVSTCTVSREWNPLPICSLVHCAVPGDNVNGIYTHENGNAIDVNSSLPYSTTVLVKCNIGFEQTSGPSSRQCLVDGTWSGNSPVCEAIQCQYPGQIVNGWYMNIDNGEKYMSGSLPYLSIIKASCEEGYATSSFTRSCQVNKMWSGKALACDLVFCSPPSKVENGYYAFQENETIYYGNTSLVYGTKLTAMCYQGYMLRSNISDITCKHDRAWTGPNQMCDLVSCLVPGTRTGVQRQYSFLFNGEKVPLNATMNETCAENYHSDMTQVVRKCTETGEFNGSEIICEKLDPESSTPLGAAVGGTAGAFVVIIIARVIVIFVQRRRSSRARNKNTDGEYENTMSLPSSNAYSEIREVSQTSKE